MRPATDRFPRALFLAAVLPVGLLVTGCGSSGSPTVAALTNNQTGVSAAQQAAVTDAARQMVADPAATVHGLVARTKPDAPGVHICGYVTKGAEGSTPLYVELQEAGGTTTAERGQVGATPANLAKVRFMCRDHGNW